MGKHKRIWTIPACRKSKTIGEYCGASDLFTHLAFLAFYGIVVLVQNTIEIVKRVRL